jgi:DNA-directed RNA polymerase specialized sigma24 family protein
MMGPRIPVDTTAQVVLLCVFHRGSRLGPDADQADLARLVVRTTVRIASAELRQPSLGWFRSALRGRAVREPKARDRSEQDALLRFYRILDGLGVAERIAFVLHKIEGLDVPTVAAAMASSPERTSRRLDRSIRKVSAALERDPVLRPSGAG